MRFILSQIHTQLFKPIDNSQLVLFRIAFGLLVFFQAGKMIYTGWVEKGYVIPQFLFTFIGFEWLHHLSGTWMIYHFYLMAGFGLMIMVGLYYRIAITGYTLLWIITYLMEKSYYNNHYYLLILICLFMVMCPAHHFLSVDTLINPGIKSKQCPGWCRWIFILQMLIVYSYAGIAKMDADWLAGAPLKVWFSNADQLFILGKYMKMTWYQKSIPLGGLLFDSLFVPLMLWRKTRNFALILSTVFHIHNSIVFRIGIFPYMMIAMNVFFYDPRYIGKLFMRRGSLFPFSGEGYLGTWSLKQKAIVALGMFYFLIQVLLPLRHLRYPGNVHWTEEGHRMAWQMMLKSKRGLLKFQIRFPQTGQSEEVKISDYLTKRQISRMSTRPDMIWQFAQYLKQRYQSQGHKQVQVYANSYISLNRRPYQKFIDPDIDLAAQKWHRFKHSEWILPFSK